MLKRLNPYKKNNNNIKKKKKWSPYGTLEAPWLTLGHH